MGRLAACAGGTAAGVGVTVSTGADVRGASEGPMLSTMAGLSVTSCIGICTCQSAESMPCQQVEKLLRPLEPQLRRVRHELAV